jgi:histidine phosphotransferase ChpT
MTGSMPKSSELAALMCARICHDLVGPVSATGAALSIFDEPDQADMREDALRLVRESAEQMRAKLEFARLAFGAGGAAPGEVELDMLRRLAGDMFRTAKAELVWKTDASSLPKAGARILLNMILLGVESAPRGGEVKIEATRGGAVRLRVTAAGPKAKLLPGAVAALAGNTPEGGFDGRTAQPLYARTMAEEAGGRLEARQDEERVELSALLPD